MASGLSSTAARATEIRDGLRMRHGVVHAFLELR